MEFKVSIDYHNFVFDCLVDAMNFARTAKLTSADRDARVEIAILWKEPNENETE